MGALSALTWGSTDAAFTGRTSNAGNSLSATSSFPTFGQTVAAQNPYMYYRLGDAPSTSSTSSAAYDPSASVPFSATYNGQTNGPSTWWRFDEGTGSTTSDSAGGAVLGNLGSSAGWATGHSGSGLSLDGTRPSYVSGSGPAVNTAADFTVAAWAYPTLDTGTNRSVISQPGTHESSFVLGIGNGGEWRFRMSSADVASPTLAYVYSSANAALNTWTHVAATYTASTGTLKLYVNGNPESSTTIASSWNATGGLQVGQRLTSTGLGQFFTGTIDDVLAYRRALTDSQVLALAGAQPTARLSAGQPGALQGAQNGEPSNTAVAFGGSVGLYQGVSGPPPASGSSSCWFKASGNDGGALSGLADTTTSPSATTTDRVIYLDSGGHLSWGVLSGASSKTLRSPLAYNDGAWHHVVGTIGANGSRLYVDGALVASDPSITSGNTSPWGYARAGGQSLAGWPNRPAKDYFVGTLDEVGYWQRQLSDQEVAHQFHANF